MIRTRLRPGVYWDAQGIERMCAILELIHADGTHSRLAVLDAETHRPILDPVEAIPLETQRPTE